MESLSPQQRYYERNREACQKSARDRAWRKVLAAYDLTEEDFDRLSASGCAVCGAPHGGLRNGREKRLHIDHNHETGEFRGLLCTNCNTALGLVDDNVDRLLGLVLYLEAH